MVANSSLAWESSAGIEIGPEYIDKETFIGTVPRFQYDGEQLSAMLDIPLRWRTKRSAITILRKEDWDSLSDCGRIIKKIDFVETELALAVHVGIIGRKSIGHGTLMHEYSNSFNPDKQPVGIEIDVAQGPWKAEVLSANILGWGVLAASFSIEPLTVLGLDSDQVHFSLSVAGDAEPIRSTSKRMVIYGAGVDVVIIRNSFFQLVPYIDINSTSQGGHGFHGGILGAWNSSQADWSWRLEWRKTGAAYRPEYFDIAYEIERESMLFADSRSFGGDAVQSWSKNSIPYAAANSFKTEVRMHASNTSFSVGLMSLGRNPWTNKLDYHASAMLELSFQEIEIAGFLVARPFAWKNNPARLFWQVEARYRIHPLFYFWGTGAQMYRAKNLGGGEIPTMARYFGVGVGSAFSLEHY